ncbi:MAG: 30S ribosome-binding factor RbfA [Patescibacteria group bacterium]
MSKRLQRINQLIKKEVSQLILKEIDFEPGILVTITRVETAKDLLDTNVFVSVFPENNFSKTIDFLNRKTSFLQKEINKSLRMKPLPRLHFLSEKETLKAGRIEEILEQLKNEKKQDNI